MSLAQWSRIAGLSFALVALAVTGIWFASGVAGPKPISYHESTTSSDWYIAVFPQSDAEAAVFLKKLADAGYPATDSVATGILAGHSVIILKGYDGPGINAESVRIRRLLGVKSFSSGSLQDVYLAGDLSQGRYSIGRMFVLAWLAGDTGSGARAFLLVVAISVVAAGLLALLLLLRSSRSSAIIWLGLGLGSWSLGIAYVWIYSIAPVFSSYQPSLPLRFATDIAAFLLLLTAAYAYIRFWKGFPQPVSDEELDRFLSALRQEQLTKAGIQPRHWFRWFGRRAVSRAESTIQDASTVRPGWQRWLKRALVVFTVICLGYSWTSAMRLSGWSFAPEMLLDLFGYIFIIYLPGLTCLRVYRYHRASGSAEDCRKIEWIWASIWLGFVAVVLPLFMRAVIEIGRYFIPALYDFQDLGDMLVIFGFTSGPLFVIIAVAISIFYKGNIEPRLALRGITMWWFLGVALTLVFVLVERTVAVKLAAWWHLSPQTGYVTAGAIVAATFQPLRKRTEIYVNRFVERVLPADVLSSGTRRTQAVAVVDISAYTALSAKDEQSALVASALVLKEARRLAERDAGRVVKSTGDGVIMCFDDAGKALECVKELQRAVAVGAATLNLPDIALHSGLHWGEVVEMRDGDIYGMTVNLAARIADWAKGGEIGLSESLAIALPVPAAGVENQGPQRFKNVPEPVVCYRFVSG